MPLERGTDSHTGSVGLEKSGERPVLDTGFRVLVHARVDIYCKRCGVRTMEYKGLEWDDTHRLAIEAWNRRAEDGK